MEYIKTKDLLAGLINNIHNRSAESYFSKPTGFPAFDSSLGGNGFQDQTLTVIAGRPGIGTTMFSLNILVNQLSCMSDGQVIVYITTSDSALNIIQRIIAIAYEIEINKIHNSHLNSVQLSQINEGLFNKRLEDGLILIQQITPNIFDIEKLINKLKQEGKDVYQLYLDSLSDINAENYLKPDKQIEIVLYHLKRLCVKYSFPILSLSKVSRSVEQRKGLKIPQLKDLQGAQYFFDKADFIYFLFRSSYYNIKTEIDQVDDNLQLFCRKNLYGQIGIIDFKVQLNIQKIIPNNYNLSINDNTNNV
jgi:replicative DNA helicase